MLNKEKFKDAKYLPLTREEMLDLIAGKWQGRVAVANEGHWLHIDELKKENHAYFENLVKEYPCDVQAFYIVKAPDFGEFGNKYCWCDVPGADPKLRRKPGESVGIDEETAITWEIINQISPDTPDPYSVNILGNDQEPDGRYRLFLMSAFLFTRMWYYRGIADSLMDVYLEADNVKRLLRKITDFYLACVKIVCENTEIDGIAFADDWGMQKGPFMSPELFKEFYYPHFKEVFDLVHSYGKQVWLHCCGDVMLLAEHFIEAGVDVLHPIQKFANDEAEFLEKYGNKVCTWVGMDLQRILPYGTTEEVREETRYLIDTFVKGNNNRVIMTIANRLEDDVPPENFGAFVSEAYEYGAKVVEDGPGVNESPCYSNRQKWYGAKEE